MRRATGPSALSGRIPGCSSRCLRGWRPLSPPDPDTFDAPPGPTPRSCPSVVDAIAMTLFAGSDRQRKSPSQNDPKRNRAPGQNRRPRDRRSRCEPGRPARTRRETSARWAQDERATGKRHPGDTQESPLRSVSPIPVPLRREQPRIRRPMARDLLFESSETRRSKTSTTETDRDDRTNRIVDLSNPAKKDLAHIRTDRGQGTRSTMTLGGIRKGWPA